MAASWLLQAIYTTLLSSAGDMGGTTGGSSGPAVSPTPGQTVQTVLANTTTGVIRGLVDNSSKPTIFFYLGVPFAKPPIVVVVVVVVVRGGGGGEYHFSSSSNITIVVVLIATAAAETARAV
ncbi:hypothetical protein ElyMa_002105300 [Elysia marginata]|uniref:Uncharacterized protein n=1 Tax=Elysia marginata TaxID=1093978 RepID=A0AAV4FF73_9GAST|nr:hypothetical protein ElyMa_002105300 [Elysia marginata]